MCNPEFCASSSFYHIVFLLKRALNFNLESEIQKETHCAHRQKGNTLLWLSIALKTIVELGHLPKMFSFPNFTTGVREKLHSSHTARICLVWHNRTIGNANVCENQNEQLFVVSDDKRKYPNTRCADLHKISCIFIRQDKWDDRLLDAWYTGQ